ncbi:MAG: hypothetical protein HYV16_01855 [Gammaproteobacteria bacterium]|nr:hypothetical protein [Gammaproteobacteria bacterium]
MKITRKGKPVGELVPIAAGKRYIVTVLPAGGDALIPLPDALMEELDWTLGDTLLVDQDASGKLLLRRADRREPR